MSVIPSQPHARTLALKGISLWDLSPRVCSPACIASSSPRRSVGSDGWSNIDLCVTTDKACSPPTERRVSDEPLSAPSWQPSSPPMVASEDHDGSPQMLAEVFQDTHFAKRVSSRCGEKSFRRVCKRVAQRFRANGKQRLPQLEGTGISVWAARVEPPRIAGPWLCVLMYEGSALAARLQQLSSDPQALLTEVVKSVAADRTQPSEAGKLRNLRTLIRRVLQVLGGRSGGEAFAKRLHEMQKLYRWTGHMLRDPQTDSKQQPHLPLVDVQLPRFQDPRLIEVTTWQVAGASLWNVASHLMKPEVELFCSNGFASQVSRASNTKSFSHLCWEIKERYRRDGVQRTICDRQYTAFARTVKRRSLPPLLCVIVMETGSPFPGNHHSDFSFLQSIISSFLQKVRRSMETVLKNLWHAIDVLESVSRVGSAKHALIVEQLRHTVRAFMSARLRRELFLDDRKSKHEPNVPLALPAEGCYSLPVSLGRRVPQDGDTRQYSLSAPMPTTSHQATLRTQPVFSRVSFSLSDAVLDYHIARLSAEFHAMADAIQQQLSGISPESHET